MNGVYEIIAELRLRDEKTKLMAKLDEIRTVDKEFIMVRNHCAYVWHAVKDPMLKKELHKELNKLDSLRQIYILNPKDKILNRLDTLDIVLKKESSTTEYDCGIYRDLDFDRIERYGICGSRL